MLLSLINFMKENRIIIIIASIILLIIALAIIWLIKGKKEKINSKTVATIGIFTAFSIVLYFLKFNLPFIFPEFLEINFSLLPVIIIGFMYGPVEAVTIVILRAIIKIPFTSTACVGEFADALIGIPVALVTSLIYLKKHDRKGAIIALFCCIITWVAAGVLTNYFINIPFFIQFYFNGEVSGLLAFFKMIPGVNESNYMIKSIIYAFIPFNLLISVIVSLVTFLVYKKISILFSKLNKKEN